MLGSGMLKMVATGKEPFRDDGIYTLLVEVFVNGNDLSGKPYVL